MSLEKKLKKLERLRVCLAVEELNLKLPEEYRARFFETGIGGRFTITGRVPEKDWTFEYMIEKQGKTIEIYHHGDHIHARFDYDPIDTTRSTISGLTINDIPTSVNRELEKTLGSTQKLMNRVEGKTETTFNPAFDEIERKAFFSYQALQLIEGHLREQAPTFFSIAQTYWTRTYIPERERKEVRTPLEIMQDIDITKK